MFDFGERVLWIHGVGKRKGTNVGRSKGAGPTRDDEFLGSIVGPLKRQKDVPEIPRSQRYAARPALEQIFQSTVLRERAKGDQKVREAVEKLGYTQRAVADHLGFHFTYVSRILNAR